MRQRAPRALQLGEDGHRAIPRIQVQCTAAEELNSGGPLRYLYPDSAECRLAINGESRWERHTSGEDQSFEFLNEGRRLGESDWISLQSLSPQMMATAPERVPTMKTPAPSTAGSIGPRTSNRGPLTLATSQVADVATTVAAIPITAVIHTRCAKAHHLERRIGCGPMDDIIALRRLRSDAQSPDNAGHGGGKSNQRLPLESKTRVNVHRFQSFPGRTTHSGSSRSIHCRGCTTNARHPRLDSLRPSRRPLG